eukprot:9038293-Pyramimonas_sp.AAC.1
MASLPCFLYLTRLFVDARLPLFWICCSVRAFFSRSQLGPEWRMWYGTASTPRSFDAILMDLRTRG